MVARIANLFLVPSIAEAQVAGCTVSSGGVSTTTSSDGSFTITVAITGGSATLTFTCGQVTGTLTLTGLTPGATVTINVQVRPNQAAMVGAPAPVAAPAAQPVPAVGVQVSLVTGGTTVTTMVTNNEGKAEFKNVPAGTFTLVANAGGTCTLEGPFTVPPPENEVEIQLQTTANPPSCSSLVVKEFEVEKES